MKAYSPAHWEKEKRRALKKEYKRRQKLSEDLKFKKGQSLDDISKAFQDAYTVHSAFTKKEAAEFNLIARYKDRVSSKHLKRKEEIYNLGKERYKTGQYGLAAVIKEEPVLFKLLKHQTIENVYNQPTVLGRSAVLEINGVEIKATKLADACFSVDLKDKQKNPMKYLRNVIKNWMTRA